MNWEHTIAWANDKLADARKKNDGELDDIATAHLRGRIAMLKELIALPTKKLVMEAQSRTVMPE